MSTTPLASRLPAPARFALDRKAAAGLLLALLTVILWASGLALTRFGVTRSLSLWDVAFLRLAVPALVLAPLLLRLTGSFTRPQLGPAALMVFGAGIPFALVGSAGMLFAPAAHAGALMPGCMPLFTALLAVLVLRETIAPARLAGYGAIVAGALCVGGWNLFAGEPGLWRGHLLFLTAGAMWAVYTIAYRHSGFTPWQGAAVVSVVSFVLYAPVYLLWLSPRLLAAPPVEVLLQLVQGVISGLLSMLTYAGAVRRIGPSRAAAFSALTPALIALIGIPVLDEWPDPATWAGIVLVGGGVAFASLAGAAETPR